MPALTAGRARHSETANAVKATRQDVQQEPAHELVRLQRHGLVTRPSAGAVILPAERDAVLVMATSRPLKIATRWV